jgi:hypothetical protein
MRKLLLESIGKMDDVSWGAYLIAAVGALIFANLLVLFAVIMDGISQ